MSATWITSTPIAVGRPLRTLITAFLIVLALALGQCSVGIWGVSQCQKRLEAITDYYIPHIQAIADARIALLTIQRDNRQVLLETDAVNHIAALLRLDGDVADMQVATLRVETIFGGSAATLQSEMPEWYLYQMRFIQDLMINTPATLADARNLQSGPFRDQELQVATQLATLDANEENAVAIARFHAEQSRASLITVLTVIGGLSLLLLIGLGYAVSHTINQQHKRMVAAHMNLGELVEEVQMQNEEMESQRESLALALEDSEQARNELDTILSAVHEGLALFDMQGKELRRNAASSQILGDFPFAEQLEFQEPPYHLMTLQGVVVPPEYYPTRRAFSGEVVTAETYYVMRDEGTQTIARFEATPIINAQGLQAGVLRVVRDISSEYRTTRYAELLRSLAHACAAALDEDAVATAATNALIEGMNVQNCSILVRDLARPGYARVLHMQLDDAVSPEELEYIQQNMAALPIAADAPLLSLRVMATGQPHFNATPLPQPRPQSDGTLSFAHRILAYVPLRLNGITFGVLATGFAPDHLTEWEVPDEEFLVAVADEIATALHRAHLYAEVQQLAYTDPLTSLHNHRAMQQALHAAMAEAASLAQPVSVIMLDVDHFRRFNETYGHAVGDRALQGVARAIQSAVRQRDVAARYGGEEFCVILPDTDLDEAMSIAERVRLAIAAARVPAREMPDGLPVTASLGCATSPQHAAQPAALLKAADLALYAAKHGGRNQVVAFCPDLGDEEGALQAA